MYEYRWTHGRTELSRQDIFWLQAACRERGLQYFQKKRTELINLLTRWERGTLAPDEGRHDE